MKFNKIGGRVRHKTRPEFSGVVTTSKVITFLGELRVYGVDWDGSPAHIPLQCRDEAGRGTKRGYAEADLIWVSGKTSDIEAERASK